MYKSETTYTSISTNVLNEISLALQSIDSEQTDLLISEILSAQKVFFVGVGRVLLALQAICKRFAHLGIDAHFVGEITEPAITSNDLLLVGSGSGESLVPLSIAKKANLIGATVIHIGSNTTSHMNEYSKFMIRIPTRTKLNLPGEIDSQQPMTTLFEQTLLIYGDILASIIVGRKGLNMQKLWQYHANLE